MAKQRLKKVTSVLPRELLLKEKPPKKNKKRNGYCGDTDTINDWNIHPLMNENITIIGIDWAEESDI